MFGTLVYRVHDVYKVGSATVSDEQPFLNLAAVAALLGPTIKPKTVSQYLTESRPGGRYEQHTFPTPNGRIGRAPWWALDRADEIREWNANRPGQGVGGGRPANVSAEHPTNSVGRP